MDTLRYYARAYAREPAANIAQAQGQATRTTEPVATNRPDFTRPPAEAPRLRGTRRLKESRRGCRAPARMD